jgi:hypothetical protein
MNDLKLCYSGGSGGFLLLHLLLLSGKFYTAFDVNESINSIIDKQWNVSDHLKWKKSETWPNNLATLSATTSLDRLYFICNPDEDSASFVPAKNLMLYTDIDSQIELSYYKKAYWFFNDRSSSLKIAVFKKLIQEWNAHYCNLKDPSWPSHVSARHINRLPKKIQQELLDSEQTLRLLKKFADCRLCSVANYKKDLVNLSILPFLQNADVVVKLQDLVNSNGTVLENLLGIPPINRQQRDLIDHWKKLHPPDLLEKIAINND